MSKYDAVVLGAGVLGLTIASELVDQGYKVAIVAKDMPQDAESVGFASPWAGCNWCSFAQGDARGQEWDALTYRRLADLAKAHPELCQKIQFYDVWSGNKAEPVPWYKDVVEDYKELTEADYPLPGGHTNGFAYKSYIIHAPRYILHLASELDKNGVAFIRKRVSSLDEAYEIPEIGSVDLVINATGLGSQTLLGIEDKNCYPARGQTVLVKAPGVKTCYMMTEDLISASKGSNTAKPPTYIIPRPGPEDHVILGGTYIADDYSSLPDLATSERILQDCFALCPALGKNKSWRDIEIISHNVGLRPSRHGGARLELEKRTLGTGKNADLLPKAARGQPREVAVVHAYGIGGSGYQSSFGMAEHVAKLVQGHLPRSAKPSEESAGTGFSLETLKQYLPSTLTS